MIYMAKKSFLLISLKENKAKKLAEVISNKTCRNILDYMAEKKDATESEISKDLQIPISTVHYNMKALVEARLVKSDEYHYSEKGKEVSHYKLANQYVIIAPEGEKQILREKLKSIIPTALIMATAAGLIKMFSIGSFAQKASAPMLMGAMEATADEAMQETANAGADMLMAEAAPAMQKAALRTVETAPPIREAISQTPEIALWFFIGAVSGVAIYLLIEFIMKKLKERREE